MGVRRKRRPSPVRQVEQENGSGERQSVQTLQESMLTVLVLAGTTLGFLYSVGVNTGPAGDFIARLFRWLFGLSSPLWFVYIFGQALIALFGWRRRSGAWTHVLAVVLVLLVVQIYLHLRLPVNSWQGTTVTGLALADELQPAAVAGGGGMIGGVLAYLLLRFFSYSGTLVVLTAALLAAAVLAWGPGLGRALIERRLWKRPGPPPVAEGAAWTQRVAAGREEAAVAEAGPLPAAERRPEGPPAPRGGGAPAEGEFRGGVSPAAGLRVPGVYTTPGGKGKVAFRPLAARREGRHSYQLPPLTLLQVPDHLKKSGRSSELAEKLEQTLNDFGVKARVVQIDRGPVVTRFEVQPAPGVKVSRIVALADDIALALAAADVRIEAPIPGKAAVGIEVPNQEPYLVRLREVLASPAFQATPARLALGLGVDIIGHPVVADLAVMPHLLIAGATGSGKSVCLNTMLISLLYRATPDEVKLVLIDPKRVELTKYEGIPHLAAPVVTEPRRAAVALRWMVEEMGNRYNLFSQAGVRNIERYNELARKVSPPLGRSSPVPSGVSGPQNLRGGSGGEEGQAGGLEPLPYLVVFIDELSDLMLVAAAEVEDAIFRLAQMARAAGIHLVFATQRPSVDVITGVIKANIPSRIAFAVSSQTDSRTILDTGGAERLLGRGDMLFLPTGSGKPLRLQGAFVSDHEVERVVQFWRQQAEPEYARTDFEVDVAPLEEEDELLDQAVRVVVESGQASASFLQRRLRVGYARAARLLEQLEQRGVVGPAQGSKPREVLIGRGELPRS